ncbi:MAG: N-(5'-phosphoribosyl)anthranilate isomerase [Jannaschia sp.]
MSTQTTHTPEKWLAELFNSTPVKRGRILRRPVSEVEEAIGRERFVDEINRRGYRALENAGFFVVFCNRDPIRIVR